MFVAYIRVSLVLVFIECKFGQASIISTWLDETERLRFLKGAHLPKSVGIGLFRISKFPQSYLKFLSFHITEIIIKLGITPVWTYQNLGRLDLLRNAQKRLCAHIQEMFY